MQNNRGYATSSFLRGGKTTNPNIIKGRKRKREGTQRLKKTETDRRGTKKVFSSPKKKNRTSKQQEPCGGHKMEDGGGRARCEIRKKLLFKSAVTQQIDWKRSLENEGARHFWGDEEKGEK